MLEFWQALAAAVASLESSLDTILASCRGFISHVWWVGHRILEIFCQNNPEFSRKSGQS